MKPAWTQRLLAADWDVLVGVVAAVLALLLHLLHIVNADVLLMIAVVLMALLFLRDMRRERQDGQALRLLQQATDEISSIKANLRPPDAVLVAPARIRVESERFSREAQGEMVWFNVCLMMFKPQSLFDVLLKPAVENPLVTGIEFVLDPRQRALWDEHVAPKISHCLGRAKVRQPRWISIEEHLSVILTQIGGAAKTECLLSFWGEPFMSHHAGRDVPRYVFLVQSHSELVTHLSELIRRYRLAS